VSGSNVSAVLKALRLLECFSHDEPEQGLAALARGAELNKSTAHRLLGTLETAGWVERTPDARYRLTLRAFELGSIVVDNLDLRREAGPVMSDLVSRAGETAYLVVPDGLGALCLERVEGRRLVRLLVLDVGKSLPLTVGGGPVSLLAYRDDLLEQVLERGFSVFTDESIADEATLRTRLQEVRHRGCAISREDVTPGVCAIGAAVFDAEGVAVAALSVSGLTAGFAGDGEAAKCEHVMRAAAMLSARLGYRPRPEVAP
jgi:IclR family KDG regulon transcriptional repressor